MKNTLLLTDTRYYVCFRNYRFPTRVKFRRSGVNRCIEFHVGRFDYSEIPVGKNEIFPEPQFYFYFLENILSSLARECSEPFDRAQ